MARRHVTVIGLCLAFLAIVSAGMACIGPFAASWLSVQRAAPGLAVQGPARASDLPVSAPEVIPPESTVRDHATPVAVPELPQAASVNTVAFKVSNDAEPPPAHSGTGANNPGAKRMALTFDDGYSSKNVNLLLDILEREQVQATFFPVATWANRDPTTLKRIAAHFEVGNHTLSHQRLTSLTDAAVRQEILHGVQGTLLRPPYGGCDDRVRAIAQSLGYQVVLWDIDSRDWAGVPPAQVVNNVVGNAGDGKIVLLHMGDSNTVAAMPQLIAELRARGYSLVTVSQLKGSGTLPVR